MSSEHPALKEFSLTWEGIKHVGSKMLKGIVYGAAILGGLAVIPGVGAGLVGLLGSLVKVGSATGAMAAVTVPALKFGAMVGGILGAVSGISSLGKAIGEREQDVIADYEQNMLARERAVLLSRGRGQSFANSEAAIGNVAYRAPTKNQGMSVG